MHSLGLQYHSTLNSQVWQTNNQLKPVIRTHLLKIANYWADFAHIPENAITDIVFTGSLANYNYTPLSDFDLHLVVDMDKLPIKDPELRVKNIFHMKALWAKTHPDIKIYGYPVELFAEDKDTRHPLTQGIYSLLHDAWIHMPTHEDINYDNDANLKSKVTHYQAMIDDLISNDRDLTHIKKFKEKLRNMRSDSIQKHGELRGVNNLVFKELRNRGYIDKLSKHENAKFANEMSIHEGLAGLEDHVRFHNAGMPLPDKKEVYIDQDGHRAYYETPGGGSSIHLIGKYGMANRKHDYTTRFDHLKDETVHTPIRFPGAVQEETEVENYKPKVDMKLRTTERPFDSDAFLQLHNDAHDEGTDIPDTPMKYGDIYHHGGLAHDSVFYTDHHDTSQLPPPVAGRINDKIKRGYTIHSMAHVYTPYGGITYAHMSMGNNVQNHLLKYDHQDNYYG